MWFNHPKYLIAKNNFSESIQNLNLHRLPYEIPKIMFICGGHESLYPNRKILEDYIQAHSTQYLSFRAEYAWEVISKNSVDSKKINALGLEEWLADFSDIVIILVESFGTVAELGAFSLSPALRKKLLPILDIRYKKDNSFINTGPIAWVDEESKYGPAIHTNFETILTCMTEIESRLNTKKHNIINEDNKYGKYKYSNKTLLFYILIVVSSLGPISLEEIISILSETIELKDKKTTHFILSIGVALNIFSKNDTNEITSFSCLDYDKLFRHESTKNILMDIQLLRARSLSHLIKIPKFKEELSLVAENVA